MEIINNFPLNLLTTFRIGGNARYLAFPSSIADWQVILKEYPDFAVTVLGRGSNVLVRDQGIDGLVIYLGKMRNNLEWLSETTVKVNAGVRLSYLVFEGLKRGLDVVFLSGIPGTVGGALAMNAGAMNDSFWNHVKAFKLLNRQGELIDYSREYLQIGYRELIGLPKNNWFAEVVLEFIPKKLEDLEKENINWLSKRRLSQPLNYPNAGSIFRNPVGNYAAYLIEQAGLKGMRYGKAEISNKHANFIINLGGAKAVDVERLIQIIQQRILEKFGVMLCPEIKVLGI